MFRPQNLKIINNGSNPAVSADAIRFTGSIRHREFLGNLIRYLVSIGDQEIQVDDVHQLGAGVFDVGGTLELALDPDQVRILDA